jgi:hypothetical protein
MTSSQQYPHDLQQYHKRTPRNESRRAHYNPYGTITPTPTMTGATIEFLTDDDNLLLSDTDDVVDWPVSEENEEEHIQECKTDEEDDYYLHTRNRTKSAIPDTISGGLPPRPRPYLQQHRVVSPDREREIEMTPESHATPPPPPNEINNNNNNNYRELLDEAERHVKVLESNVALHKQLAQLEEKLYTRDRQLEELQAQMQQLLRNSQQQEQNIRQLQQQQQQLQQSQVSNQAAQEQWDAAVVTWKIAKFEKKLTAERHFFESSSFSVGCYASFYLTVCVLEVEDTVPESRRPVAIFLKAASPDKPALSQQQQQQQQHRSSSIFPIRLDGSKITLVSNKFHGADNDLTVQVGQTQMEDASQGKGVRKFITLGELRQSFLQNDASVIVRATVRVPHIPIYRLQTLS